MLKNVMRLQGVTVLGKAAQKLLKGGDAVVGSLSGPATTGCGVVYFDKVGGAVRNFIWADDTNGNGTTREEAIAISTANNSNPNSLYRTGWCCTSCGSYA